ncbi:MAG: response regulator [Gammaproteobacteria bacterium]|nr:response regulator [Gammaproteobacteria bacterium]
MMAATERAKILLVDDDPGLLRLLSIRLKSGGFVVDEVESAAKALVRLPIFQPQVVITDLRMEGMDGMALFEFIHERFPTLPVIILTAHGTIPDAVQATRQGVFSYLTKPFDSKILLENVKDALRLSGKTTFPQTPQKKEQWRGDIISRSQIMDELLRQAKLVADTDVSILIQSQSGTGKELLARAIHKLSSRRDRPFVALNCAAVPEALLESELFGHRKGSFTGATSRHQGLFHAAEGGTLFLDEIGNMPLLFQAKLLRVLEDKEVRPVGSTKSQSVDVRIISATHVDMEAAVAAGTVREDLYYRLNVVTLEIPPLAKRREDIPLLTNNFLAGVKKRTNRNIKGFSQEAMELLVAASWPGNVRQLQNVVEQAVALSTSSLISAKLVQKALRGKSESILSLAEAQKRFEREYLVKLLQITEGNVSQAARLAQRNRTDFYKLLNRFHIEPAMFRNRTE